MTNKPQPKLDKSKIRWERDLGISADGEVWSELCKEGITSYLSSRYRLTPSNFLHQVYFTPSRLHKFSPLNILTSML